MPEQQQAFVLRIAPSQKDRLAEALKSKQIIIGWSESEGLLDPSLTFEQFRKIIKEAYYSDMNNLRKAGYAAGNMWRFIREMKNGDLVVVPYGPEFYVAEITGPATYDKNRVDEDTAYRRPVEWLTKKPIPRDRAKSALISRMKIQGTSAYASDLLPEIKSCLERSSSSHAPNFLEKLQHRLIEETLKELQDGFIDERRFEVLIQQVLLKMGAGEARIIARNKDAGADIVATFRVAGTITQTLAVQAKYWRLKQGLVGRDVVKQLIRGIEAEDASLGLVITSGEIAEDAGKAAEDYFEESGIRIELLDGKQFAKLLVEQGISLPQTVV